MKKNLILAALSLFVFTFAAFAQKTADFSGTWNLDLAKSKLSEREKSSIESQTLAVTQTATGVTVDTATKRNAPPAGAPAGGPPPGGGRGGMGGGGMITGDGTSIYSLDGKESKVDIDGPRGKMPATLKAKAYGDKLILTATSAFSGPMGDVTVVRTETWRFRDEGKTLTIEREMVTPRGSMSSTMVYSKKQ